MLTAGGQERSQDEGHEQALRVADVQEVGGREDEREPGGAHPHLVAEVGAHQPIEERGHEERGDAAHHEGGDERVTQDPGHRAHQPREEREEDDVQGQVTRVGPRVAVDGQHAGVHRPVAQDGKVLVVGGVPSVPDLQEVDGGVDRSPGQDGDGEDAEPEHRELQDERQPGELEVGGLEAAPDGVHARSVRKVR